jgi:hypothetical protein
MSTQAILLTCANLLLTLSGTLLKLNHVKLGAVTEDGEWPPSGDTEACQFPTPLPLLAL